MDAGDHGDDRAEEPDRTDDDALADAILRIYTSSVPVIPDPADPVPAAPVPEPGPAEPEPTPEPAPPAPSPEPPAGPQVWDLDEDPGPSRVWDLGDLPPGIPFGVPPVTGAGEAAEPPADGGESWTRLAEPDTPSTDSEPDAPQEPSWAPPVWEPEPVAPAPTPEDRSAFSVYSDAGVDPGALERMQAELDSGDPPAVDPPDGSGARRQPTPWFDLASAPPPDPSTAATTAPPPEPDPTDPEPAPPTYPPPAPPTLVAPAPTEPERDSLPTIASLPPGTVRTSPLPPGAPPPAPSPVPSAAESEPPADEEVERLPSVRPAERAGTGPTPADQRAGRTGRLFWLWFAPGASLLSLAAGAVLFSTGMSLRQAIIAALLGVAVSFLPLGVVTVAGRLSGQPTLVTSRATFGVVGNVVPAIVALATRAVLGGALLAIAGDAVAAVLAELSLPRAVAPIAVVVLGAVVIIIAGLGYGLVSRALFVLAALAAVLLVGLVGLTVPRVDLGTALTVPDGPWILILGGIVTVLSLTGLAWAQSGGDVARYQSRTVGSGSGSVVAAATGVGVPAVLLVTWGALLGASSSGTSVRLAAEQAETLLELLPGWAGPPFAVLVAATSVAGASVAAYSCGFAVLATGIRLPRPGAAAVGGALVVLSGVALSLSGLGTRLLLGDVLTTLAVPVAAWVGILGAETIIRRRRLHAPSLGRRDGVYGAVRLGNLLAFAAISAIGWGLITATPVGLRWEGWIFPLIGIARSDAVAQSDVGVLVALGLALLVPVVGGIPAIRRQEAVRARSGPVPAT